MYFLDSLQLLIVGFLFNCLTEVNCQPTVEASVCDSENDKLEKLLIGSALRTAKKEIEELRKTFNNIQHLKQEIIVNLTVAMNNRIDDTAATMNKRMIRLVDKCFSLQQNASQKENCWEALRQINGIDQCDNRKTSERRKLHTSE